MLHQGMQWVVTAHELELGMLLGVLLLLVVLYINQRATGRDANKETEHTPLEELQLRYINGEINEEQYQQMRQGLAHG